MNQEIYFRGICYISDEIIMKHISLKSSNACMDMKFCQYGPWRQTQTVISSYVILY